MIMLIDSVGQEFIEDTAGKVCLCLLMSGGLSWNGGGLRQLGPESSSSLCLAPGLGSAGITAATCDLFFM